MNILYVHRYDPKFGLGGAAHVLIQLAVSMRAKFQDKILCAANSGPLSQRLLEAGIETVELPSNRWRLVELHGCLRKILREFKPDLVHSHHRYLTFILDLFFKGTVPILHTEHVLRHDKRWLFRYGDYATAVSPAVSENLNQHYHVPSGKITTITNAVQLRPADAGRVEQIKKQYRSSGETVLAVVIGRLDIQKGHTYLIEAVRQLPPESRQKLKILLLGDGPLEGRLRREVNERQVESHFAFAGYTREVSEFLHAADFLILPSLWEGMPLSILEAYGAGKPVVATDIPGTREHVIPGKTGLLVPVHSAGLLAAALRTMVDQAEQRSLMAREAAEYSRQFSFEKMLAAYRELYKRLAGQRL